MHIAFLTPEYPSSKTGSSGGIGTSVLNLAHALVHAGVRISVFIYSQSADETYDEAGIHFYRIKNQYVKGLSWWFTRKKIQRIINTAIAQKGIDLVEVADWTGMSAFMKLGCPVVMRLHGSDTYFCHLDKRPVKWWNKFPERTAYKQADHIIAVSDFVGRKTNEVFGLDRHYTVIPNSIDTSKFKPIENTSIEPIVLYFGTLIRKKGVLDIPLIFNCVVEQMPQAKLLLVGGDASDIATGSPSTWDLMQALFSDSAMQQVQYLGKKPYREIQEFIQLAQVCIFPSYAEALPVSWLEAMAMGKSIVASDIGWAKEMMEDGKEAYLIYPSKHEVFANAIIHLLSDSQNSNDLGKRARIKVEAEFSTRIILQNNIELYRSMLGQ